MELNFLNPNVHLPVVMCSTPFVMSAAEAHKAYGAGAPINLACGHVFTSA